MDFSKFFKKKSSLIITIVSIILILALVGTFFFISQKKKRATFSEPEYLKEIVLQKEHFDGICDNFLDIADTFSGSKTDIENLELRYQQAKKFVKLLEIRLSPVVPDKLKNHFNNMMSTYSNYLEALEIYKNALPMELGYERNEQIEIALDKFKEANDAFKNLKN